MRKAIMTAVAVLSLISVEAQLKTPAPSPTQTIKQDFGLTSIELSYSRPGMKGRKIYGDLVPVLACDLNDFVIAFPIEIKQPNGFFLLRS